LAHEAKAVLDSWVRYEGQVKARQQQELARSIIAKIEKDLENPKTLDEILRQSVKDVESKLHRLLAMESIVLIIAFRDCG
jgi:F-type H+-transporting ATPase subunit b